MLSFDSPKVKSGDTLIAEHSYSPKRKRNSDKQNYHIFTEQFLEKPYVSGRLPTLSATICTWRGKETIDDPDID